MKMTAIINRCIIYFFFLVSLFGCTSTKYSGQTPKPSELEVKEVIEIEKDSRIGSNNSRYSFKNLSPNSSYKFIDGKKTSASVDFELDGGGEVEIYLSINRNTLEPYTFKNIGTIQSIQTKVRPTWEVTPRGNSIEISSSLFVISRNDKKTTKTLLKKIKQAHPVYCNNDDFFLVLWLKRTFNYCLFEKPID